MSDDLPDNGNDEFSTGKMVCVILLLVLAFQLYIISRPTAISNDHSQTGLATKIAPTLSASSPASSAQNPARNNNPAIDREEVELAFRVGGRIAHLFFTEHAAVKQGDILATLDRTPFEKELSNAKIRLQVALDQNKNIPPPLNSNFAGIETARAKVEAAQHTYDVAQDELMKHRKLLLNAEQTDNVDQDNIQNVHDAELDLERAHRELARQKDIARMDMGNDGYKAAIQIARNNVDAAKYELSETRLVAPADGTIISRNVEVGATITPGTTVYTLSVPNQ